MIVDSIAQIGAGGVVCLTGVGSGGRTGGLPCRRRRDRAGAAEQRDRRVGQRQQAALLQGRAGAGGRRPRLAGAAGLPPRRARGRRRRAAPAARTTSRSSWTSRARGVVTEAVACTTEQTQLGEGTRWDARRGELLRVDILAGRVYRDRVADDGCAGAGPDATTCPGTVGALAPVADDDGWVLAAGQRVHPPGRGRRAHPDGRRRGRRAAGSTTRPATRRAGCGPAASPTTTTRAAVRSSGSTGTAGVEQVLDGLTIPNGMGWSRTARTMYLIDSGPRARHGLRLRSGARARSPSRGCSSPSQRARARRTG